jgi:hypothetical protein
MTSESHARQEYHSGEQLRAKLTAKTMDSGG